MIAAQDALERLRRGNAEFVSGKQSSDSLQSRPKPADLASGQQPFAIILGCSDSRVPAEIVFNQGLGDLFIVRVAGNIAAPSQIGSVEFAAAKYNARLVVVLGHTQCGAVIATLEELAQPAPNQSKNLRSIVDRVRPSVEPLYNSELRNDADELMHQAVRANVLASVNELQHGSEILEQLIRDEGLRIVGAEYSLETGVIEFFDAEGSSGPRLDR